MWKKNLRFYLTTSSVQNEVVHEAQIIQPNSSPTLSVQHTWSSGSGHDTAEKGQSRR